MADDKKKKPDAPKGGKPQAGAKGGDKKAKKPAAKPVSDGPREPEPNIPQRMLEKYRTEKVAALPKDRLLSPHDVAAQ